MTALPPRRRLIQQAVRVIATGEFFKSCHVHDFVGVRGLPEGLSYAVDGGCAYIRRCGDLKEVEQGGLIEEYSLYTDDSFETICDQLLWGSRGKSGDEPLKHSLVKDLTLDHLKAILETQWQIRGSVAERAIQYWAKVKEDNKLAMSIRPHL